MEIVTNWWGALSLELHVFYAIALVGTAVLVLQTILLLFGFGGVDGGDVDLDGDVLDSGDGGHILSVRTVVAFLVGFGWTGVICLKSGMGLALASVLAMAAGIVLMMAIFFLMRFFYGLRESGTLDFRNAIGEVGTVYLPIPASRQSHGQVEVMIQGRLMVVEAVTAASEKIPNRAKVKVIDTVGSNSLLVEPLGADAEESKTS